MPRWRPRYDDDQSYGPGTHDDRGYGMADWSWDVYDYTHEYENDWLDRFDDSEGSTRNAFSSLFGNRGGRRRSRGSRLPWALQRDTRMEDSSEEAGSFEGVDSASLKELAARIESLTKTVEKLVKAQRA